MGGPVASGAPVEVEVRGVGWISGRIAWVAEGRVGVAFDHEIDPMLARKPVGTGKQTPAFVKPILPRAERAARPSSHRHSPRACASAAVVADPGRRKRLPAFAGTTGGTENRIG
ncbi:MAG: hypothetical protein WDN24_07385 [Sphingomonas sp.]